VIRNILGSPVGVILANVLNIVLKARVNLNLSRLHMGQLPVLLDVFGSTWVASLLLGEHVLTNAVIRVVTVSDNVLSSVSD